MDAPELDTCSTLVFPMCPCMCRAKFVHPGICRSREAEARGGTTRCGAMPRVATSVCPAHVRASGRRTSCGAVIWRTADGPRPGPEWLTPDDAAAALRSSLASAATRRIESTTAPTFAQVCEEWLQHGERERRLKRSALIDYRAAVSARLVSALGFLPVDQLTPRLLEAWRDGLLDEATISHRTKLQLDAIVPDGPSLHWRARERGSLKARTGRLSRYRGTAPFDRALILESGPGAAQSRLRPRRGAPGVLVDRPDCQ